jgi:hypothetical protein
VKGAPFRHIGGAIIADHGPLSLRAALDLADFYRIEAARAAGRGEWTRACRCRAQALLAAVEEAAAWRRAGGWSDPFRADAAPSHP